MGCKFITRDSTWEQFIVQSFFIDLPEDILQGKKEGLAKNVFCHANNITTNIT
jgi:hypothetical protein